MAIAPGRVNLIGEHTDYSLLPVLPMAIDRWVAVAAGQGSLGRVRAFSTRMGRFVGGSSATARGWARYVAAALRVTGIDTGIDVAVAGDLPVAAGLSSSSALTVGAVAAVSTVAGMTLGADDVVQAAVTAERSLGVAGGEMDQTVIVHARRGTALRIDFLPRRRRLVPIPEDWSVIIADTGVAAAKAATAKDAYNARVVASRLAAALVGARAQVDPGSPPSLGRAVGGQRLGVHLGVFLEGLPDRASPLEVAEMTGGDLRTLVGNPALVDPDRPLPVEAVARHILAEAYRVDRFEDAMGAGDLIAAGILLDDSQRSLERFGVSTGEIDSLVTRLRAAGAAGARLTGAGFGGHVVALCRRDLADEVTAAVDGVEVEACDGLSLTGPVTAPAAPRDGHVRAG